MLGLMEESPEMTSSDEFLDMILKVLVFFHVVTLVTVEAVVL